MRKRLTFLALLALATPARALDGLEVTTSSGFHHFEVEIAADEPSREKGLMFRKFMPADRGMLFEFDADMPLTFWMKDTVLSLDLIFVDSHGVVENVAANAEPMSESIIASAAPARAVLELNAGTAASIGLKPGDHVTHPFFKP